MRTVVTMLSRPWNFQPSSKQDRLTKTPLTPDIPAMAEVPETGEFIYREAMVPTVYDEGDDSVIGILWAADGESLLSILYRPFGFGRGNDD